MVLPACRVLMLLGNNPYPQDPRVFPEATVLAKAGLDVVVACPRGPGQPRSERIGDVRVIRFPAPPEGTRPAGYVLEHLWVTGFALLTALALALRPGFDVVHVHNPPDTLVAVSALLRLLRKRVVFDHHDLAPELYAANGNGAGRVLVHRALVALETASCRVADRVIAVNESHKRLEVQRAAIPPEKISVVRNGPDLERFRPVAPDPWIRGDARFVIGWVGSIGHHDGVDHLLEALHELVWLHVCDDVLCLVIGDGEALPDSRRLARELGLGEHVRFTGFVPYLELSRYLCSADVCVVSDPSNPYNDRCTMIKVMEYMALSRPIVAYDLPETRVSAGDAALYVEPGRPDALARGLMELRADHARCAAMGRMGRRRVREALAWRHSVPELLDVYRSLDAPISMEAVR